MLGRRRGRLRTVGLLVGLAGLLATAALVPERPAAPLTAPVAEIEQDQVRDTEAEAIVAAAALQQPVEVLAYRSEYRDVFAQPDGTLIANDHAQAVRVIKNGAWVPTDATLLARPDGTVASTAALVDARFSGGGTAPLVVVDREGRTLSLQWPYPLPAPTLDGDQAVYQDVFPDVDLVVNATVEGFSHVIVLKTPEAANLPELQTLELGVTAVGLTVQETENGGVIALDPATGNPVIDADAPIMWDSGESSDEGDPQRGARAAAGAGDHEAARGPSDSAEVAPIDLTLANGVLRLTPDAAMLADPDTNWPVYLDPVWQATTNSSWGMVDSGYPNEEYYKFDGKRHERIGLCPERCNSSRVKRLFYTLATPYSGRTILTAEFRVTMQHAWNSNPQAASLYLMPKGISTSTNWNNQPGGSNWGSGANLLDTKSPSAVQSTCTSTNQNAAWNAQEAVQLAANNGWSSVTLGLKATNEGNSQHSKRFCDNGVLSVRYNRAPSIPSNLSQSPGGDCVYGEGRPIMDVPPQLQAVVRDPDQSSAHTEQVKAEFRLSWTSPTGAPQTRNAVTPLKASGSLFTYQVPADLLPDDTVISWEVRGSDNTTWGLWSSDGTRTVCEFEIDRTSPSAPDVDSPELLPLDAEDNGEPDASLCRGDDEWRGSIGVYANFTFDAADDDVLKYRYGFNTNPLTEITAPFAGGPATVRWMPDREGPQWITVQAVDQGGRSSTIATCTFRVGKRPPTAQWALDDVAGDQIANDPFGGNDASVGSGVTFGVPGPGGSSDTAARLDGTPNGYLNTANTVLTDTSGSFAVTGWVKVTDPSRRQVVVSQDGTGEPGFSLGVDAGAWVFRMPVTDVTSLGEWKVSVPGATTGWTYLAAIYDATQQVMSLQVNNANPVTAARRSLTKSRGAVQLGRRLTKSGYTDHWAGELADITVFDRLIQPGEIEGLKKTAPQRKAYWQLNTVSGSISPELGGGAGLTLGTEAAVFRHPVTALLGGGHLALTGKPASNASTTVNADTAGSFTVATRVRLSSSCAGTPMTVFSLKGAHSSAVSVRCNAEGHWEMTTRDSDTAGAEPTVRDTGLSPKTFGKGDHLAVVYNGYLRELLLYVNGEPVEAIELTSPFQAVGGLQLGRGFVDDGYREHLSGAVDDVRIYDGAADQTLVQRINLVQREQNTL